jgi:coenzyme F420-reducing hydrogenase alpha subunit
MKVKIPYLSRIEGHAHLIVDTKAGEVLECQLEVVETPRFFER